MDDDALAQAREKLWLPDSPVTTLQEAADYLDGVGFAVLFPAVHVLAPSLWEAVAGPDADAFADGMGADESRIWAWKDELPEAGLAWCGRFAYARSSLLSPRLLAALYTGDGEPTDHLAFELPPEAHTLAEALIGGALPTAALREIVGDKTRYNRAMVLLQRHLLIGAAGTYEQRAGWPSTLIDLTCRLFPVGDGPDYTYATARFVQTMIEGTAGQLARAYCWPAGPARDRLAAHLSG